MTREPYKVLSLFAGIGGFDLGLERTGGFKTVAFCEIDKKAQAVLRKHWPEVPIYDDVRTVTQNRLAADGLAPNFICAGFPCQDISYAGRGAGLAGERSGLFYEVARLIGELEPRGALLENVSALLTRGLGDVLGTLASLGYDAQWHCIPASAIGARHRRDRIWIVAHPDLHGRDSPKDTESDHQGDGRGSPRSHLALESAGSSNVGQDIRGSSHEALADPYQQRLEGWLRAEVSGGRAAARHAGPSGWWHAEPNVGRVAHGIPGRVDRLKQLGNAVVPQIPELIGRAILAAELEP